MINGFDQNKFLTWMAENFLLDSYSLQIILSILDYAHKFENDSKDRLAYFVSDILPEVEFLEVAQFCNNEILTNDTLKALNRR